MEKLAIIGAGGKMGLRITSKMKDNPDYDIRYVETAPAGIEQLKKLGVTTMPLEQAAGDCDMLILAIPDRLIKKLGQIIVPLVKPGSMIISLDPAAAYAGVLPDRKDISYFVAHPCHPPLFGDETAPEARNDWFGTVAKQSIVCAIFQGTDAEYAKGEALAKLMWRPVINAYRVTVEQMALCEPALVETFSSALVLGMKMMLERTIEMGVPKEAAEAFFWGHVRTSFGIIFGFSGFPMSDGAMMAMKKGMKDIFQPDWMEKIMNLDALKISVKEITDSL